MYSKIICVVVVVVVIIDLLYQKTSSPPSLSSLPLFITIIIITTIPTFNHIQSHSITTITTIIIIIIIITFKFTHSLTFNHNSTDVFLVCFSLENPNSLENCHSKWAEELKHYNPDTPIVLVGTKLDLKKDEEYVKKLKEKKISPVTTEQGQEMKDKIKACGYIECSAKTMENLTEAFNMAIDIAMKQRLKDAPPTANARNQKKKCQLL